MRVLIVGAGIGGPTLAYWLLRGGHEPVIVERAPALRTGGFLVDFWGAGFDVAERMGIVPDLLERGYRIRELRELADDGRRIAHLDPIRAIGGAHGRYVSIARTDLAAIIYGALAGRVETIFDDTVDALADDGRAVSVEFASGRSREFDLVVGADGLHSRVRALSFGPETSFERSLGIAVAAFEIDGYRPREELVALSHTEVGSNALRVALDGDATMVVFTFRYEGDVPMDDLAAQHEFLHTQLRDVGWEVPAMLASLPRARTFYLDRASQILMPSWSRGRVGLVGDAAAGPSLMAGQGSALAMVEAYTLAAELARTGDDHAEAFLGYRHRLGAIVRKKQDAAIGMGAVFAPRNRAQLLLRNSAMKLMAIPGLAPLALKRSLRDPIELPPPPGA